MSSKATIINTLYTHVYEDCDSPNKVDGKYAGHDVVWVGEWDEYAEVAVNTAGVSIQPMPHSYLERAIRGVDYFIPANDVRQSQFFCTGFQVTIKGGSASAKRIPPYIMPSPLLDE